jgi:anaerobic C4-dicarboxylate transporter
MIDWWGVFHNLLWVTGLAVCLAVLSMAHYETRVNKVHLRQKMKEMVFQLPFTIGVVLFCLGLLLSGSWWWEKAIWGLLTAILIGHAIRLSARPQDLGHTAEEERS